jgi:hypothetical protein
MARGFTGLDLGRGFLPCVGWAAVGEEEHPGAIKGNVCAGREEEASFILHRVSSDRIALAGYILESRMANLHSGFGLAVILCCACAAQTPPPDGLVSASHEQDAYPIRIEHSDCAPAEVSR